MGNWIEKLCIVATALLTWGICHSLPAQTISDSQPAQTFSDSQSAQTVTDSYSPAQTINDGTVFFNVLTQNTYMVPIQSKLKNKRSKIIGTGMRQYDVAFLQEAFGNKVKDSIAQCAGGCFSFRYAPLKDTVVDSGQVTFGKFRICKCDFKPYSTCRGGQCLSGRGILYVQFQLPNGMVLDTFNVHLQAIEKDDYIRRVQLTDLMTFVCSKNNGDIPVMIAGDFNVIAENCEYRYLRNRLCGFRDVWYEARPHDPGYTWNPTVNTWGSDSNYNESRLCQRLDYVFVRDGRTAAWSISDAQLAFTHKNPSDSDRRGIPECIHAADHFGVQVQLALTPVSW